MQDLFPQIQPQHSNWTHKFIPHKKLDKTIEQTRR